MYIFRKAKSQLFIYLGFSFFFLSLGTSASQPASAPGSAMKLWYNKPAGKVWESALPLGNGKLGAMVYGNVQTERIQLNEHTLWSGSPNRNDNPLALDSLETIRRLIFEGKQKQAENLANKVIISKQSHGQIFGPAGELHLSFPGHDNYTNYYRELDLERAVAKTSYTVADVTYTREVIASFAERVIAVRLTASRPGSISFTASFTSPQPNVKIQTPHSRQLTFSGTTIDHEGVKGMVKYKGITHFSPEGGEISSSDTSITVKSSNAVTIYISVATNFNNFQDISGNENNRATSHLTSALRMDFSKILKGHISSYQKYFNRVKINLGATNVSEASLPTNERLKNFSSVVDPEFAALYYQFGRYLLISSSQPGGQPANLQGIWNGSLRPAWDSKYTININAQMNYWPAEKTNLSELHEPFLRMVKELAATGQKTAKDMYGARGWVAHHNTDIWRTTGAVDGAFWGAWTNGGGWTSQHLWEHYLYTGDVAFLKSAYPILKGAALFYIDYLIEHPKLGYLVANPDESPENAPAAHQGSSLDAGVTMTNQIIFDVFSSTIRAAELLKKDKAFIDTLVRTRDRLAPMHIGQHAQIQEWLDDIDDPRDNHRHVSHLYGLFPSNQISAYRTPDLFSAAKTTLLHRGDLSTGWSMGWKVNWWARLQDGNHAYKLIQNQLTPVGVNRGGGGTYDNLFDAHPPFQIDGNFGCVSGMTEMLMQSADGSVHLLPAVPDVWRASGSISGIKAVGGFEIVQMEWKNAQLTKLVVKSLLGGNLRLRVPNALKTSGTSMVRATGENTNPFYKVETTPKPVISSKAKVELIETSESLLYDVATRAGKTYTFQAQDL
ncbi:alpha-L-fucosidase 2 [Arcticibacter pallidicorallinus]|uniref:Alpha-L-fucosidase 2 n=1 Tax=Arcticibacter pallidicorallinus TaxID=1259464 RepID=A0A2T0U5J1_9SPHI|nr:glycoside hydrolase family 95 protein [Arcticibacter pallidicorallinus]PRY53170.1 alpha-L-fucosidase 2 [Arcticibacter pallidicorallinus]